MLAVVLGLMISATAAQANPNPAPVFQDLFPANGSGHVVTTFDSITNTFNFTVFNDQTGAGNNVCAFAIYPSGPFNGTVPSGSKTAPAGWVNVGWETPINPADFAFGNVRDSFAAMSSTFQILPQSSLGGFSIQWIGSPLPNSLSFGIETCRGSNTCWFQAEGGFSPVPDASTLALVASGAAMALPTLRSFRRRRSV